MMYRENKSGLHILEIEITEKCNLNCVHCYVDKKNNNELSNQKVLSIIDQSNNMGLNRLVFAGGEPLLHKNIFNFALYAKELGIPEVMLMTNGLLISDKNIDKLKIFDAIQISIDVPPNEKGHFRPYYTKTLKTIIQKLLKKNINVSLFATLHKSLLNLIEDIVYFASSIGVRISFNDLIPITDNLKNECLTPVEKIMALKKLNRLNVNYDIGCSDPFYFLADQKKFEYLQSLPKGKISGGCMAGIAALYIDAKGEIFSCPFVKVPIGNIENKKLIDIWENSNILKKLRKRENYNGECSTCQHLHYCGGCRASAYIETGDLYATDPKCFILDNKDLERNKLP